MIWTGLPAYAGVNVLLTCQLPVGAKHQHGECVEKRDLHELLVHLHPYSSSNSHSFLFLDHRADVANGSFS